MLKLSHLYDFDIMKAKSGLEEPSGIALARDRNSLLVVDDESGHILRLDLNGALKDPIAIGVDDLEGISIGDDESAVFAVGEKGHRVFRMDLINNQILRRARLEDMDGYGPIRALIEDGNPGKGLEGIAWCSTTHSLFCLREASPCLLIEIDAELTRILSYRLLDPHNGFPNLHKDTFDVSGICHDPKRDMFWIVSHKAQRAFLYSWKEDHVRDSARLTYPKDGDTKLVDQVEGVAVDTETDRLFTVCDDSCWLYIHAISGL